MVEYVPVMSNQPFLWNRLKSKFHFKLALVKVKNQNWYLSVLFAKVARPPYFLQQMQDGEATRVTWLGSSTRCKGQIRICIDKSVLKRSYLTMQCERSGIYKSRKTRKKLNLEGIGSRKCNCPFRLKDFFDKETNDWWLAMLCGMHNHDLDE